MPNSPKIFIFILSYLLITHSPLAQNLALAKSLNDSAVALMMKFEKDEKVIELLDKAIAADSNFARAYENKVGILLKENRYSEALVLCSKLVTINPQNSSYFVLSGALFEKITDTSLAQKMYTIADEILVRTIDNSKITSLTKARENLDRYCILMLLKNPQKARELASSLQENWKGTELSQIILEITSQNREEILNGILLIKN